MLLASFDGAALAEWLAARGGAATAARSASGRVLRHVFRRAAPLHESIPWSEEALAELGVGAWARGHLATLDPTPSLSLREIAPATDGSRRLLLETADRQLVESVLIPGPARTTLCVSSQVGCARACAFCETGTLGLVRQLDAAEIVDQVRIATRVWAQGEPEPPLSNVVFMGMGEPLDNLANVARAVALLTDGAAFGFAPARITVSTVGVADRLDEFYRTVPAELAVSLNAPDDERRARIMPIARRVPLADLRAALVRAMPTHKKVLLSYVLFAGFNDADADADAVADFAAGLRCRVNVIPSNPGPDPALVAPEPARLEAFVRRLRARGVTTLVRRPRGRDIGGACGQLAGARRSGEALVVPRSRKPAASP